MLKSRIAGILPIGAVAAAISLGLGAEVPTAVPGADIGSLTITAAGDYSSSPEAKATLDTVSALAPDAHFALGDLAYNSSNEEQWCEFVKASVGEGFPFELIAGNHESDGRDGHINDFSACLPNQLPGIVGIYGREYYADLPSAGAPLVRMISVSAGLTFPDSTWSYSKGDKHYEWTEAAIDDARAAGIPWVVVATHLPCLSIGTYDCPLPGDFFELLQRKSVDLVLYGHEHAYMRTHQLRSGTAECSAIDPDSFNEGCVSDSDSDFVSGFGTVFATVGTGGAWQRPVDNSDPAAPYFASASGSNTDPTWGVLELSVAADELGARFVRSTGGNLADAFVIRSNVGELPAPTGLAAVASADSVALSWDAVPGATGYIVRRDQQLIAETSLPEYIDSDGLQPDVTYNYDVAAVNDQGPGQTSDVVSVVLGQPGSDPVDVTSVAVEDSWVRSDSPSATHGSSWVMRSKASSADNVSYLRFDLPAGEDGRLLSAAELDLRVWTNSWSGSTGSFEVCLVQDNSWSESSLSWSNRPAVSDTVLGTLASPSTTGQVYSVTLTAEGLAALAGGQASLAIVASTPDTAEFATSEVPSGKPLLRLTYQ